MNYMMELEINSQGILIENLINEYIKNYCVLINIPIDIKRINIVASGSSYNAGFFGKYFFENISKTPTSVDFASEVANGTFQNFEKDTLFIFISQSGKSTDTLEALKKVKNSGAKTFVITNNENSPMYELGDYKFNIKAGLEHAIAATSINDTTFFFIIFPPEISKNEYKKSTENFYILCTSHLLLCNFKLFSYICFIRFNRYCIPKRTFHCICLNLRYYFLKINIRCKFL